MPVVTTTGAAATVPAPTTPADELEQLAAPIALYPDVLVALILPAATESSDVVLAARFLANGGAEAQIETQPWDDSVKGLAHYPEVVKWMDENLEWTQQIGAAYLEKPEDVMAAVQRARARAMANGLLTSNAQQQVVVEDGNIRILPAQANAIYVPRYDPEVIYVERPIIYRPDPWLTFGVAWGVGSWLRYDCDWHHRVIVVDHRHWPRGHVWRHPGFTHRPDFAARDSHWRAWRPSAARLHHHRYDFRNRVRPGVIHPKPIADLPGRNDHRWPGRPDWSHRGDRGNLSNNPANRPNRHRVDRVPPSRQPALNAASAAAALPPPANVQPQSNPASGRRERDHGQFAHRRDGEAGTRRHFTAPQNSSTTPSAVRSRPNFTRNAPRPAQPPLPAAPRPQITPNRIAPQVAASAPAPRAPQVQRSAPAFTPHADRGGGGHHNARSEGGGGGGRGRGRSDRVER